MIVTTFLAAALAGAGASPPTAAAALNAKLEVAFAKLAEPHGQIMLALFDSEAGYKSNTPVRGAAVPVGAARVP